MENIKYRNLHMTLIPPVVWGVVLFGVAPFLVDAHRFLVGILFMLSAILLYFYFVWRDHKNYLSFSALFSAIWFFTIGLASLQLTDYQVDWINRSWWFSGTGWLFLIIGLQLGRMIFPRLSGKLNLHQWKVFQENSRVSFGLRENRLFAICMVVTAISLIGFILNIYIKGYLPFFSNSPSAYTDFYTRFNIFTYAGTTVSGLCYFCLKKLNLSRTKRVLLWCSIIYLVFLMPILIVSRGTFIVAALSLTAAVFFLNGKKSWVMVLCFIIMFAGYEVGSVARNLTDEALNDLLQPKQIEIIDNNGNNNSTGNNDDNSNNNSTDNNDNSGDNVGQEQGNITEEGTESNVFQLPPKVLFVYTYFTVGHDNFDQAVRNSNSYAWGVHQLVPFNVIIRSNTLNEKLDNAENYLIRPYLNTGNLFSDAYYDFHLWGILFFALLWGTAFGIIESFFLKYQTPCSFMVYGNTLTPVFLSYFTPWMSIFSVWLLWGTAFLIFLVACFTIHRKED